MYQKRINAMKNVHESQTLPVFQFVNKHFGSLSQVLRRYYSGQEDETKNRVLL